MFLSILPDAIWRRATSIAAARQSLRMFRTLPDHQLPMDDLTTRAAQSFRRHFVTLSCVQLPADDAQGKVRIFSGFVIDIDGDWFYVTAGHILRQVQEAISKGHKFDVWRLGDHAGADRFEGKAVPFEFAVDDWIIVHDDDAGLDYAVVQLRWLYRRCPEAGGITAIERQAWGTPRDPLPLCRYQSVLAMPST